mmetsp:Transcript_16405/g.18235  ORF Transcript_16405/g.18235 Transcript_16405/m.18235 type:complete len:199 (-) Transcript_16405:207-803(-)
MISNNSNIIPCKPFYEYLESSKPTFDAREMSAAAFLSGIQSHRTNHRRPQPTLPKIKKTNSWRKPKTNPTWLPRVLRIQHEGVVEHWAQYPKYTNGLPDNPAHKLGKTRRNTSRSTKQPEHTIKRYKALPVRVSPVEPRLNSISTKMCWRTIHKVKRHWQQRSSRYSDIRRVTLFKKQPSGTQSRISNGLFKPNYFVR